MSKSTNEIKIAIVKDPKGSRYQVLKKVVSRQTGRVVETESFGIYRSYDEAWHVWARILEALRG